MNDLHYLDGDPLEPKLRKKIDVFVRENIVKFHEWRAENINNITLQTLINNKNPYLFRAKNLNVASDLISALLAARLSSAEEGKFGEFLEELAIFIAAETAGGQKSGIEGIDIELSRGNIRYLVAVKSGRKWGNAQSKAKQTEDFKRAVRVIRQSKRGVNVQPVLGICYGNFRTTDNGAYMHIGGQNFWHLLSGHPELYIDIIGPLGHEAKKHDEEFNEHVARLTNRLTQEFTERYCRADGAIDWAGLVQAVSGNMDCE